jgi:fatty acid desaturase
MYVSRESLAAQPVSFDTWVRDDPRVAMAERLPAALQPFLTWLTAKPAPGEAAVPRKPMHFVRSACGLVLAGCLLSVLALTLSHGILLVAALALGMLLTTSGLGLFQVVIFHHCSHGTVFSTRARNRTAGRLISALLLFKHFDSYQHEHMLHHNANKLFTDDDEFTDFVVGICNLKTSLTRKALWRRLVGLLVSPVFHARFMSKRIQGAMFSQERSHNLLSIGAYTVMIVGSIATHHFLMFTLAWLLPLTVLLQIATVFRILCEHRLPDQDVIDGRGKNLVSQATVGVFPGRRPPARQLTGLRAFGAWSLWWADMLTVQLFVRVFVLVGDAPCHDFHHRRPGKRWTDYIRARQTDLDAGCPGFPVNYIDTWGLLSSIDGNFAAMERAPDGLFS